MIIRIPLLALVFCLTSNVVYAWGNEGHRIAALMANEQLSDHARSAVRELIGTDDLSQIATYLDDNREELESRIRGSSRWHYENREVCGSNGGVAQCPQGDCITGKIEHFVAVLKNKQAKADDRAEALRVLVHLIADLHQPLHLSDNHDRGGNDVFVLLPGEKEPRRLHEAWDTRFLRWNVNRRSYKTYAHTLSTRFKEQQSGWQQGTIALWAEETHSIGKRVAYEALPAFACSAREVPEIVLSSEYVRAARNVVDEQLAKSAARIAFVLNTALK